MTSVNSMNSLDSLDSMNNKNNKNRIAASKASIPVIRLGKDFGKTGGVLDPVHSGEGRYTRPAKTSTVLSYDDVYEECESC